MAREGNAQIVKSWNEPEFKEIPRLQDDTHSLYIMNSNHYIKNINYQISNNNYNRVLAVGIRIKNNWMLAIFNLYIHIQRTFGHF